MVEHYLGVVGVVSSNLVVPTNKENPKALVKCGGFFRCNKKSRLVDGIIYFRGNFGSSAKLNCKSERARLIIAGVSLSGGSLFASMTSFNASGELSSP